MLQTHANTDKPVRLAFHLLLQAWLTDCGHASQYARDAGSSLRGTCQSVQDTQTMLQKTLLSCNPVQWRILAVLEAENTAYALLNRL